MADLIGLITIDSIKYYTGNQSSKEHPLFADLSGNIRT